MRGVDSISLRAPERLTSGTGYIINTNSKPTIPPVSQYDEYIRQKFADNPKAKPKITGAKLRRAVIMRSEGSSNNEIGEAIGTSKDTVSSWLRSLPVELSGSKS